jgi:hypothetical protein
MSSENRQRNVFISHHHNDDDGVTNLTDLLSRRGYQIRNSSIRAKPANQRRLDLGLVKDETIRRLLRMKIAWAGVIVVLIGKETHSRPWVNWEIEEANRQGKRIVGVYERGGTEADIPSALEDFSDDIVAWNSDSIIAAIEGTKHVFQTPDGTSREPAYERETFKC